MKVKFITTELVKDTCGLEKNNDDSLLTPYIYIAQDIHINRLLGEEFTNHLKDGVVNSTLTADEKYLIDNYIQPALVQWTYYEVFPHTWVKSTNKGPVQQNSEWSSAADQKAMQYIRSGISDLAEGYSAKLVNFLCKNPTAFPIYTSQMTTAQKKVYFTGIHIPKSCNPSGLRSYNEDDDCCGCGH